MARHAIISRSGTNSNGPKTLVERRVSLREESCFYFIITVLLSVVQGLILFCFLFKYSQTPTSLENRIDIRGLDIASSLRSLRISSWNVLIFFFKKYRGYWKSKIGICIFKARKFSAVRSLITILYPLEDEDKSVNCFVVIILDYSERRFCKHGIRELSWLSKGRRKYSMDVGVIVKISTWKWP